MFQDGIHGLPIETAVTKLGYDRKKMGILNLEKSVTTMFL